MVGKIYPSEKITFTDPETGARIVQYTQTELNRTLYFTNRPYSADGEHIVFISERTGRRQMFLLHLQSGKIVQLTDVEGMPNFGSCVHPQRSELYFHSGQKLLRVNWETWETEVLLRAPDGWAIGILNLNTPPWLCFNMLERSGIGIRRGETDEKMAVKNGNVVGNEGFYLRERTLLYRLNVDSGRLECVWGDHKFLDHVQMSPVNSNLYIFCSWAGYGDNRTYALDLSKRAKVQPFPMFPESARARGGHESFTRRGNLYTQWMEGDLEEGGKKSLFHGFRKLADVSLPQMPDAPFEKFRLPENHDWLMHHFTMSEDEIWGVHDRWLTAPNDEQNMSWLSIFRHQQNEPQTIVHKLCFHNGGKGDVINIGPDITLDARDEWVTYTSFLGGQANICQVHVTPFVEKLMK